MGLLVPRLTDRRAIAATAVAFVDGIAAYSAPGRQRSPAGHHDADARGHPASGRRRHERDLVLLLGATGTYLLRLLFITLIPAHRLPDGPRRPATGRTGGAGALISTDIGHAALHPANLWPSLGRGRRRGTDLRTDQESRAHDHRRPVSRTDRQPPWLICHPAGLPVCHT